MFLRQKTTDSSDSEQQTVFHSVIRQDNCLKCPETEVPAQVPSHQVIETGTGIEKGNMRGNQAKQRKDPGPGLRRTDTRGEGTGLDHGIGITGEGDTLAAVLTQVHRTAMGAVIPSLTRTKLKNLDKVRWNGWRK